MNSHRKPVKVVILAAGLGERLRRGSPRTAKLPKPLVKVFGLPLIEHKLLHFKNHPVIVVYSDEKVEEYLLKRKKTFPHIKFIKNPHPERENGYSLALLKDQIDPEEKFILVMSDHIYHESFYEKAKKLIHELPQEAEAVIISTLKCDDPEEATKIQTEPHKGHLSEVEDVTSESFLKVKDIGKKLQEYNAFDSGIFLCTGRIVERAAIFEKEKEKFKLSDDVMKSAAREGKFFTHIHDAPWMDVDTPEDLKKARKFFRKILTKPTDGPVSKFLNRKISTAITPLLLKMAFLTPNLLTILTTALGLLAAYLFATARSTAFFVAGGLLAQLSSILDGCDGEVARIKNMKSEKGALLDSVLDRYVDVTLIFSLFWGWLNLSGGFTSIDILTFKSALLGLFLALTGTILVSYSSHLGGKRPYFATRDVRLLLLALGAILSFKVPIPWILLTLGMLSHLGVAYSTLGTLQGF